ncbi:hypothetical protein JCM3770_000933 [Rhodotorula araucariae]
MTSPAHPTSSVFGQSTPALAHRIASLDASSSSPPADVIGTPSDRYVAPFHSKNNKQQPRRSGRIRTSSGNGHLDSSPQVSLSGSASFLGEPAPSVVHEIPTRTRAVRTASVTAAAPEPVQPRVARTSTARGGPPARALNVQSPADALTLAQAHGITPDQFEQAKQQVMRFLRTEQQGQGSAGTPPPLTLDTATYLSVGHALPSGYPASQLPQHPYQPSASRTPLASSSLQSAFELDAPFGSARSRPRAHFEDATGRSLKRQRREPATSSSAPSSAAELAVRQWAQEESSSSSEDDAPGLASQLVSRRGGATPGAAAGSSGLMPSPALGGAGSCPRLGVGTVDVNASPSLAGQRGMMDRFMSSLPVPGGLATTPAPQLSSSEVQEQPHPPASGQPQTSPTFAHASPTRKPMSYPQRTLLSPAPSRPKTSILFSPDVARLLRSELDELEANDLVGRNSLSPRKEVDRSSDIVVDSSPFRGGASPFSSGGASRSRDIFSASQEPSAAKRARWNNFTGALNENRATSPTPSSASLSMRAPSFCDSSPAASDRGSVALRNQCYLPNPEVQAHPASAPDFLYGAVPSSSPTSSHHSEYVPARLSRSSPGPNTALARSDSSSAFGEAPPGARQKRAPARRTDSLPTYLPAQGGPHVKPAFSYAALIGQALFSTADRKMALADIYAWIMRVYPYFKKDDAGWQNSIRHNLSLNQCFIKTARGPENPGKGCLWAIKPGTEDQFVDGDFVRRGGQGNTRRKGTGAGKAAQAAGKLNPTSLFRAAEPAAHPVSRAALAAPAPRPSTPSAASSRSDSPAASVASRSTSGSAQKPTLQRQRQAHSPAASMVSIRSVTPSAVSPAMQPSLQLEPPVQLNFAAPPAPLVPRPASAAAVQRYEPEQQLAPPAPAQLTRSHSSMGFLEPAAAAAAATASAERSLEPIEEETKPLLAPPVSLGRTFSAPMLATQSAPGAANAPPPASPPPSHYNVTRLHEPLLSATMSPPTSVYHRLAGPYQPLSYGSTLAQNHRALALLASPEASGIMASRGSPRMLVQRGDATSTAFLPTTQQGRKRQRTESDSRMLSPTALVHTQSPISSVRGGPRTPMSPVQDKLEPQPDPEKKHDTRAAGTRLLPAVNALASSDFDPFRSPPPSSSASAAHALASAKYHLRSPSARLQAALSTPGGHGKGRQPLPLGFSPSLATGSSWERSTAEPAAQWRDVLGDDVVDAGVGEQRLYWPSPGAGSGAAHLPW